jgi:hypothetical protein
LENHGQLYNISTLQHSNLTTLQQHKMSALTLRTTITFNEPIEKVWKGLTDPALVKQYFFGTNLSSDFKKRQPHHL